MGSDGRTAMRSRLVQAAAQLLAEEGPGALTARRLASEVGASTMVVYTHFDGMDELVRGVAEEGFAGLAQRLAEVPTTKDPVTDIARQGLVYRQTALANPHLYAVMFGSAPLGQYRPPSNDLPGRYTFEVLVESTRRAMDQRRFNPGDPEIAAAQLWCALHGFVTLELAGFFTQETGGQTSEEFLGHMFTTQVIGLGDTTDLAARSIATLLDDPSRL